MSHAGESFLNVPARLSFRVPDVGSSPAQVVLPVTGQGTIGFRIGRREPFSAAIRSEGWDSTSLRWTVDRDGARLRELVDGEWRDAPTLPGAFLEAGLTLGLDPDPACVYWFSFDYHNRRLRYGKGEMRLGCMISEFQLPLKPVGRDEDPYRWMERAHLVEFDAVIEGSLDVWRDPVVADVPMKVVPHDLMTMTLLAGGVATVPGNLTPTCRKLYDNVAGSAFELATEDFPEFADAIRESIADPDGWCRRTLDAKATEFGDRDADMTYLRITLGQNQGDSPGVPFVMEIWPVGHYSPVHNHGGAEAVIKVLHGAVDVDLYRMLSPHHRDPFATASFREGEVAWISERLNQVHRLVNRGEAEPCITIQCYLYGETNQAHWPYFDYVAKAGIAHFDPNSDDDYLTFRDRMRDEWTARRGGHPRTA